MIILKQSRSGYSAVKRIEAYIAAVLSLCLFSSVAQANNTKSSAPGNVDVQQFSVKLGANRIIYDPAKSGAMLSVVNAQDYPMLVQTDIFLEDKTTKAPFAVTPPLFRLDGGQTSRLRLIRTGGDYATDRESLHWVCVKGIPPKADDLWAKDDKGGEQSKVTSLSVKFSVNSCIKMFIRPDGVKGKADDAAAALKWQKSGNKLTVTNASPFYINLSQVTVGGKEVKDKRYVAPLSSETFTLPAGGSGPVEWKAINDFGGESVLYKETS